MSDVAGVEAKVVGGNAEPSNNVLCAKAVADGDDFLFTFISLLSKRGVGGGKKK
jgi:hypothetical protein